MVSEFVGRGLENPDINKWKTGIVKKKFGLGVGARKDSDIIYEWPLALVNPFFVYFFELKLPLEYDSWKLRLLLESGY